MPLFLLSVYRLRLVVQTMELHCRCIVLGVIAT